MRWAVFWEQFKSTVHSNTQLDNAQKLMYLRSAIKDPKVATILCRATTTNNQYEDLIVMLKKRCDRKRMIYRNHTMALVECPPLKTGSYDELATFMDTLLHNLSSLKDSGQYNAGAFSLQSLLAS